MEMDRVAIFDALCKSTNNIADFDLILADIDKAIQTHMIELVLFHMVNAPDPSSNIECIRHIIGNTVLHPDILDVCKDNADDPVIKYILEDKIRQCRVMPEYAAYFEHIDAIVC